MAQININLPSDKLNRLNNFYLSEYGYDIHTQLVNFVEDELAKASEYPTTAPEEHPIPTIFRDKRGYYSFEVTYPDGKRLLTSHKDYSLLLNLWNEWSVTGFDIDERENILAKVLPEKVRNIQYKSGRRKYIVVKEIDGKKYHFGQYASFEEAFLVKKFLEKKDWDLKYHSSNVRGDDVSLLEYASWLLGKARVSGGEF